MLCNMCPVSLVIGSNLLFSRKEHEKPNRQDTTSTKTKQKNMKAEPEKTLKSHHHALDNHMQPWRPRWALSRLPPSSLVFPPHRHRHCRYHYLRTYVATSKWSQHLPKRFSSTFCRLGPAPGCTIRLDYGIEVCLRLEPFEGKIEVEGVEGSSLDGILRRWKGSQWHIQPNSQWNHMLALNDEQRERGGMFNALAAQRRHESNPAQRQANSAM
jgi:hypothetical protein